MSDPRSEPAAREPVAVQQRAAPALDPAHVAVLGLCALALAAIAVHYLGAGR